VIIQFVLLKFNVKKPCSVLKFKCVITVLLKFENSDQPIIGDIEAIPSKKYYLFLKITGLCSCNVVANTDLYQSINATILHKRDNDRIAAGRLAALVEYSSIA